LSMAISSEECIGSLLFLTIQNIPKPQDKDKEEPLWVKIKQEWLHHSGRPMNALTHQDTEQLYSFDLKTYVEIEPENVPKSWQVDNYLFTLKSQSTTDIIYSTSWIKSKKRNRELDSVLYAYRFSWGDPYYYIITQSLYPEDENTFYINIELFIQKISLAFSVPENSLFNHNLRILMKNESINKSDTWYMKLEQFSKFATRFGPIRLMIQKVRDFINYNGSYYHGQLSVNDSETILVQTKNQYRRECFLIRNSTDVLPQDRVPNTVASFTFSYTTSSFIKHSRLYVNQEGYQGWKFESNYILCENWNELLRELESNLNQIANIKLNEYAHVPNKNYELLKKEEPSIEIPNYMHHPTPQIPPFDEDEVGLKNQWMVLLF